MSRPREIGKKTAASARRGTALIETALVLPILLFVAFGVIGVGRVTRAQMAVDAVTREASRSAAMASDPESALNQGLARAQAVASEDSLTTSNLHLTLDVGQFARGGQVEASASYPVAFGDLPLLSWAQVTVTSVHVEPIDPYRSRWTGSGA